MNLAVDFCLLTKVKGDLFFRPEANDDDAVQWLKNVVTTALAK